MLQSLHSGFVRIAANAATRQRRSEALSTQGGQSGVALADDASLAHILKFARARPGSPVGIAQFNSGKVALVRQPHVDADQVLPEPRDGLCRQGKCVVRPARAAEMDRATGLSLSFRHQVPVVPANADQRRFEIAPARARLAAEGAIALVDIVRAPFE
jgi:hypothetical protein